MSNRVRSGPFPSVQVDREVDAGYIALRPSAGTVLSRIVMRHPDGGTGFAIASRQGYPTLVVADLDNEARLTGVEFLGFDDETLGLLRDFLRAQSVEEPADLADAIARR